MEIRIPVSAGELIDKITILEIKTEFVSNKSKAGKIHKELELLNREFGKLKSKFPKQIAKIESIKKELIRINLKLWDTENILRELESKKEFDNKFIKEARNVYRFNDKRAKLKNEINRLLGSKLSEIKSYPKY